MIQLWSVMRLNAQDTSWNEKSFISKVTSIPETPNTGRIIGVSSAYVAGWTTTLLLLNELWYADYPRTALHSFDDSREWLQVDKVGHAYSAYRLSLGFSSVLQWSGLDKKKSVYLGAASGILSQTVIEILDGTSAKWGFSWSDMAANTIGSGLYAGQYALWGEQRIWFKFSTHFMKYPGGELKDRAEALYGTHFMERILKDYNAQTYWFSGNLKSFLPKSNLPPWLNIAVGYGGANMYGGFENTWLDESGQFVDRRDILRLRQFYLAPDIDLSRIPTKSKYLKALFSTFNIKVPLPTLEIRSNGDVRFHPLYF